MDLRFLRLRRRLLKQQQNKTVFNRSIESDISAHGKALPSADSRPESLEKKSKASQIAVRNAEGSALCMLFFGVIGCTDGGWTRSPSSTVF